jgi:predicted Zn-dependent protease
MVMEVREYPLNKIMMFVSLIFHVLVGILVILTNLEINKKTKTRSATRKRENEIDRKINFGMYQNDSACGYALYMTSSSSLFQRLQQEQTKLIG